MSEEEIGDVQLPPSPGKTGVCVEKFTNESVKSSASDPDINLSFSAHRFRADEDVVINLNFGKS